MSARHPSPPPAAPLCVESGVKHRSVYSCFHIILLEPCWTWPPRMSPSARRCWVWLHSSLIEDVERRESAAHHRVDVMATLSHSWWVLSVYAKWTKEHLYFLPTHQNDAVERCSPQWQNMCRVSVLITEPFLAFSLLSALSTEFHIKEKRESIRLPV